MDYIYFDNAATSWPKPDAMMKAMMDFNKNIGANPGRSGHRLSIEAARVVFNAREIIANILNAHEPDSIIFTKNATEGINIILHGFLVAGDHVITTSMEHNSVMRPLHALEAYGIELTVVQCSPDGELEPEDIKEAIKKNTRLIITTHASNVTGTIMPITDIARIAKDNGIVYCVDAAQTAGSLPIDVKKDDIDILVFTGHKSLYGPQGT
ncbi:MAG: aminotransferase class V-fold PLP-dependent enzyme, partial [Syntrophorhabdaceae bacterium]|nr:aminotransferase class V-fold PLP-dependent enzyme [Syntrophorhabdaceae bacterium]